jgi:hypothetical protein
MKRLRDDLKATDPTARAAAHLLQRLPPLAPDAQRQRRVRLKMGAPRRRPPFGLQRLAIALFILLISVAGARAMAGGGWAYALRHISWLALPAREVSSPTSRATPTHNHPAAPKPAIEAATEATTAPAVEPTAPSLRHHPGPTRRVARSDQPTAARLAPELPRGPGATLMIEAMAARRAGDLGRAERLLTAYRRQYPDGALQEEALVLSLEAAQLRGDPAAAELARTYLTRFPQGRFKARVEQVLRPTPR